MRGPKSFTPGQPWIAALTVLVLLLSLWVRPAAAAPASPEFGPVIEDYAPYVAQKKCRPKPKPGVVAFRDMVMANNPETYAGEISRKCSIGGASEHKEGRAWDWGVDASDPLDRAAAKDLLGWLLATDSHGNTHALVRRVGIMYVIWNRRMWSAWEQGWEVYCVQKAKKCKDPDSKAALNPHTDHVHFSFGWPGARMLTSFWNAELSHS